MILSEAKEKEARIWASLTIDDLREEYVITKWDNKIIVDVFIEKFKALLKDRKNLSRNVVFVRNAGYLAFARTIEEFSTDKDRMYNDFNIKEDPWKLFCKDHTIENVKKRYRLIEEIGKGNYGIVYKAEEEKSKTMIALKVLNLEKETRAKIQDLKKELEALKRLSYRQTGCDINIPCLYDWYCIGENKFIIAMELIEGDILFNYMTTVDKATKKTYYVDRTPSEEDKIIRGLARGVNILQNADVIHMDLHQGNILIDKSGRPKIIDFGLACFEAYKCEIVRKGRDWTAHTDLRPPEIVNGTIKPISRHGLVKIKGVWEKYQPSLIEAYKAADIWMLGKLIEFSSRGQRKLYRGIVEIMTRKNPNHRYNIKSVVNSINELQTYKKELTKLARLNKTSPSNVWFDTRQIAKKRKISFRKAIKYYGKN